MLPARTSPRQASLSERYRVLLEIGRGLTRTLSLPDLFRQIYRETSRVLDTGGFYVSLYDPVTDEATVVFYADRGAERHVEIAYRGSDSDVLRLGTASTFSAREGPESLMVLGDDESDVTRSAVSAPMRYEGTITGAISAQSYEANSYTDDDVEMLQGIADMAAVAIENARKVEEIETRRREAEQIEEIGRAMASSLEAREVLGKIIEATIDLIRSDSAGVWFLKEGSVFELAAAGGASPMEEGISWRLSPVVRERVVEARAALGIPDLASQGLEADDLKLPADTSAALIVPLIVEEEVVGALAVGSRARRAFDGDVDILERLASQASVALENARLHASVQALSLTDPLTGLPNRRHLDIHLHREIAAARRGRSLAVVIFDLDHFKRYNDTLGHQAGDRILKRFAEILEDESRSMNLVARYGGDEFISVVSDTALEGVLIHAQRVARRVLQDRELGPHQISVSYGIGIYAPEMADPGELIRAADDELYRTKGERAVHRSDGS